MTRSERNLHVAQARQNCSRRFFVVGQMTSARTTVNFEQLYSLKQFIDQIRQHHVAALRVFADEGFNGFKLSVFSKPTISISSTATCIGSLMLASVWDAPVTPKSEKAWWATRELDYLRRLLKANWTSAGLKPNNPFSVAFVLEASHLLRLYISRDGASAFDQVMSERVQFGDEEFKNGEKAAANIGQITTYHELLVAAAELLRQLLLFDKNGNQKQEAKISVLEYPPPISRSSPRER